MRNLYALAAVPVALCALACALYLWARNAPPVTVWTGEIG